MKFWKNHTALKIALLYTILAGLWILLSDQILARLLTDPQERAQWELLKGWAFVVVTGLMLYSLLRRELDALHRSQQETQESEAKFRALFEHSADANLLAYQGVFIDCNQSAVDLLGAENKLQLLGLSLEELSPGLQPDGTTSVDTARRFLGEVLDRGIPRRFEWMMLTPSGHTFPAEVALARVILNNRPVLHITFHDLTERKQMEESLRQSQAWLQRVIETAPSGIILFGPEGEFTFTNQATEQILGLSRQELSGMNFRAPMLKIATPEGQPIPPEQLPFSTAWKTRQRVIGQEIAITRRDGERRIISVNAAPMMERGVKLGVVVSFHDITQRKESQMEIERQLGRITALRSIDHAINTRQTLSSALDIFLTETMQQLEVDGAAIMRLEEDDQTLTYISGMGLVGRSMVGKQTSRTSSPAWQAVRQQQTLRLSGPSANRALDMLGIPVTGLDNGVSEYFAAPLSAKGKTSGVLEIYHRQPLRPAPDWLHFLETLAGQAALAISNFSLYEGLLKSTLDLAEAYQATLAGWSKALEMRDQETQGHSRRVTELTMRLAREAGLSAEEIVHIERGSLLHDIGKMGVPDTILQKPQRLTDEEWRVMRMHPIYAYQMLVTIPYLHPALDIPYYHHEWWDGSGYPNGIKGEEIPLAARIFALVDVWDALRSNRPYRPAWPKEKVVEYIQGLRGKQFDPEMTDRFLRMIVEEGERV